MVDTEVIGRNSAQARRSEATPHHILAASSVADERTRVLKHGDTFAVFDHYGDIKPGGLGEEGLYHEGTRFLSCLTLELEGSRPFFLNSLVREENDQLAVDLTNPDLCRDGKVIVPLGTLHLALKKFLWQGACYQQLRIKNHGLAPVTSSLALHFRAARRVTAAVRRHLEKAFYGFEPDFFQQNLLRIVDDVVSVIKGSIELWPTLVEICYFHKDRKGLPQIRVKNQER
jgi:glycogen debranching enzyme